MYTQEDFEEAKKMSSRRLWVALVPMLIAVVAGIVIFVMGRMQRSDSAWIWTTVLTIVGGAYFLFTYGVWVRPALLYKKHIGYMLNGRLRETTGVFKAFAEQSQDKEGLECYAMFLNVGDKDDPVDDRLFYYDAHKEKPVFALGTRVTVYSNDKMVANMIAAKE